MSFLQFILPQLCLVCQLAARNHYALCAYCEAHLPALAAGCEHCALPLYDSADNLCGQCLKAPPPFERTIAAFAYTPPIDQWILKLKFYHQLNYAHLLGQLLAQRVRECHSEDSLPEAIIPIPIHSKRNRQRGFNQTMEIAKPVAKQLNIPINNQLLIRTRHTQAQSEIDAKHRKNNIAHAFSVTKPIPYHSVAVIDDVITTGATIREVCYELKNHGVKRIEVWCCARTLLP